jgi:hypothetical protein
VGLLLLCGRKLLLGGVWGGQHLGSGDADLIHYTRGASEKEEDDEEDAIRKAVDFATTARRQTVDWSGLPCEARFWERKMGPAAPHYL